MKKPNICYEIIDGEIKRCPFVDAYDDCVILRKKGIWTGTTWAEQYSKCPLVEVPEPHDNFTNKVVSVLKDISDTNIEKCTYKPDCPWYDGKKCNSPNDHTYNECDYDRGIFPED